MSNATRFTTPNPQVVVSLDVSPDGRLLAVGQQADAASGLGLTLWSLEDQRLVATPVAGEGATPLARFSASGRMLAHTDGEQRLVLRDLPTGVVDASAFPLSFTKWMSFASQRDRLIAGGTRTQLWDAETGAVVWTLPVDSLPMRAGISPPCCALTPDGERVAASGVEPGRILVYDVASGAVVAAIEGTVDEARSMAIDPAGRFVAAVSTDGTAGVWKLDGGEPVLPDLLNERANSHWCVRFHPDGERVAFGHWSGFVQVVRLRDGTVERGSDVPDHLGRVWDLAFTRDGRKLFSGGDDGVVLIHEVG